jgi:hypothetical protein
VATSISARLDSARKENRELRLQLADAHVALTVIPAQLLSGLAELAQEIYAPSRTDEHVRISRTESEHHGHRTNHAAARELKRVQAVMMREGDRLCGNGHSVVGDLDKIVHGRRR